MTRPVTLFTGQFADIPLAELAPKAAEWGYDGLELACWGDHLDVDRAANDRGYAQGRLELPGRAWAEGLRHQQPPGRPARMRPQRRRPLGHLRAGALPRRRGGQAVVGRRGDGQHRQGGPEHGPRRRQRFHRLVHLAHDLQLPPGQRGDDRRRVRLLRRDVGPYPGRVRQVRRQVWAGGAPHGDRLRYSDVPSRPRGRRAQGRLRLQLRSQPTCTGRWSARRSSCARSPTASITPT